MPKKEKRILFIGDIIGEVGRNTVRKVLPGIKKRYKIDYVIANGEHLSARVGVEVEKLREMQAVGVDFFTTGNHVWREAGFEKEIGRKNMPIVRPANFLEKKPGHGFRIISTPIGKILIINLLGREGIKEKVTNPFKKADAILASQKDYDFVVVDFHAEMTSEKVAMGYHLDSHVAAVFGTHTHVPTADVRILPGGTAFVSDVGMTGPLNSVLGVKSEIIVERFLSGTGGKFEVSGDLPGVMNAVLLTLDGNNKAIDIKRIDRVVKN
ncbi:MAG: TIGR00282 family metallophosphoesterase [Patescibacteria group bacterium]|nr:TIGR00282 family metallophosphoesterase [Patescibacteria group bacterium]